jgi:hypothetical protein
MAWPIRSASTGFAWSCLQHMKPGNFTNTFHFYPAEFTQTGTVECTEETPVLLTYIWVYFLVALHLALCVVVPVTAMFWIKNAPWPKTKANGPFSITLVSSALPVLAVGAFAEVAQHVFDNWLYLGLIPSYYLAVFYGGLTLGQSMLALGIWNVSPPKYVLYLLPASGVLTFAVIAYAASACREQAADAVLTGPSDAFAECVQNHMWVWVIAFFFLAVSTVLIFVVSSVSREKTWPYFIRAMVSLAVGIISSLLVTHQGMQIFHVTTAGGFLGLFWTELKFITQEVPYGTDSTGSF